MKTLKKALCLVLALVMVVGTMAISAAATDFNDDDEITYKEAVAVLNAAKIIDGYDNGNFGAKDTLTRAQGIAFVVRAILGRNLADQLNASAVPFSDVNQDWQKGVIAYAVNEKLANGWDGKFDPDGKLTGYAFAKFWLLAIGADGEYTGNNWENNVLLDANKYGLLAGQSKEFKLADNITREQAAQMALVAVQAGGTTSATGEFVVYDTYDDNGEDVTEVVVTVGSQYEAWSVKNTLENDQANADHTYTIVEKTKTVGSLNNNDKLFEKTSNTTDEFGRPATSYYVKATKKTLVFTNTPVLTSTAAISASTLYTTLGATGSFTSYAVNTVADGQATTIDALVAGDGFAARAANNTAALGANGVITEIYKTGTNSFKAVQIVPALSKLTNITSTKATKTVGSFNTYSIDGVPALTSMTSIVTNADYARTNVDVAEDVAKGDYVIVTRDGEDFYTVEKAELVTGKKTGYKSSTGYVIDGKNYLQSAIDALVGSSVYAAAYNTELTYALDAQGNVINVVSVSVPTNYIYVVGNSVTKNYVNPTNNLITPVEEATSITTAGELVVVKVSAPAVKGLYTYTVNSNGVYTLTAANADNGSVAVTAVDGTAVINREPGKYANNATKYYVASYNETTREWSVVAFTGYKNIKRSAEGLDAVALDADLNSTAEVVFINGGTAAGTAVNFVYVSNSFGVDSNGVYTYEIINKDAKTTRVIASGFEGAGLYSISAENVATAPVDGETVKVLDGKYVSYKDGVLFKGDSEAAVNTYVDGIAANVPVYTYENGDVTVSTADALSATTGRTITVTYASSAINAIYIVK